MGNLQNIEDKEFNEQLVSDWLNFFTAHNQRAFAVFSVSRDGNMSIQCIEGINKMQMAKQIRYFADQLEKDLRVSEN